VTASCSPALGGDCSADPGAQTPFPNESHQPPGLPRSGDRLAAARAAFGGASGLRPLVRDVARSVTLRPRWTRDACRRSHWRLTVVRRPASYGATGHENDRSWQRRPRRRHRTGHAATPTARATVFAIWRRAGRAGSGVGAPRPAGLRVRPGCAHRRGGVRTPASATAATTHEHDAVVRARRNARTGTHNAGMIARNDNGNADDAAGPTRQRQRGAAGPARARSRAHDGTTTSESQSVAAAARCSFADFELERTTTSTTRPVTRPPRARTCGGTGDAPVPGGSLR